MLEELKKKININRIPEHVAIIMDGNGRWAKKRKKNRLYGHKHGAESVRAVVEACVDIGVKYLTVYAFSSENWKRSESEVKGILKLIQSTLLKEIKELSRNNVAVRFIGSDRKVSKKYMKKINNICEQSWNNKGLNFNVAFNYGGRLEIVEAINKVLQDFKDGKIEKIDEENFSDYLYTKNIPDPDLVIRTSGEIRLSNFLTWQTTYSEWLFTDTYWPDFRKKEFFEAIIEYQDRERRFGAEK